MPPYIVGNDIDTFIATHTAVHYACKRAGNPMNNIDKIESFIGALGARDGPFTFTIHAFEEATPSLTARKFEDTAASDTVPVQLGLASRIRQAAPFLTNSGVVGPDSRAVLPVPTSALQPLFGMTLPLPSEMSYRQRSPPMPHPPRLPWHLRATPAETSTAGPTVWGHILARIAAHHVKATIPGQPPPTERVAHPRVASEGTGGHPP